MQKDNKLEYLRVFSCFLVILGHISNWYMREFPHLPLNSYICALLYNGICRVSVPMFFMISGALILEQKTDYKKNTKRSINILIKTAIWTLVFTVWDFFYLGQRHSLREIISNPVRIHFWFLYVLFGIYITIPIWKKLVEDIPKTLIKYFSITFISVATISFVFMMLRIKLTYEIPLLGDSCYVGYFIMGYIIRHYADEFKIKNWICIAIITVCIMMTSVLTLSATLKTGKHIESFTNFKSIFIGLPTMTIFYMVIKGKEPKPHKWISVFSFHSFNIYMLHVFFLDIFQQNIDITNLSAWIGFPIFFVLLLLPSLICSFLYEKAKGKSFNLKTKI